MGEPNIYVVKRPEHVRYHYDGIIVELGDYKKSNKGEIVYNFISSGRVEERGTVSLIGLDNGSLVDGEKYRLRAVKGVFNTLVNLPAGEDKYPERQRDLAT
jgi:co-chaperonin GroES (HSP10)